MEEYLKMCAHILTNGEVRADRTGTGTISVFGYQARYSLDKGLPLLTTKDMRDSRFRGIVAELLWFISGDTNMRSLVLQGVNIWNDDAYRVYKRKCIEAGTSYYDTKERFIQQIKIDEAFAKEHGELGPIYGKQWRNFGGVVDQLAEVIENLKNDPFSRRHLVSAWNPIDTKRASLPPCHVLFQFYVSTDYKLSCKLTQRSCDIFLGAGYNIASYSILTILIARLLGFGVGEFIHEIGDAHIYLNHVDQVKEQLKRKPYKLPKLIINERSSLFDYQIEDFSLEDYESHGVLKGAVSVGE